MMALFLLPLVSLSMAQELKVTTWNLEHFMSREAFERWKAFCEPLGWDETRAAPARPSRITYCSAHNGLSFPEGRPQSLALHDWARYEEKVRALRQRATELQSDVFALQEVSDVEALRLLFPDGRYRLYASDADIAQQVAFAVREPLRGTVEVRDIHALAVRDDAGRAVRPALELTLAWGARKLRILNVHLKSSCARYSIDAPELSRARDESHRNAIREGCAILRKQVPYLEHWVEERAAKNDLFILAGDFNRDFGWELKSRLKARLEGSDSTDPQSPITYATRIGALLPELSDRDPPGSFLWLAWPLLKTHRHEGRETCHRGIDNFLVGAELASLLAISPQHLRAHGTDYGEAAYGHSRARPSDHCPLTMTLRLR